MAPLLHRRNSNPFLHFPAKRRKIKGLNENMRPSDNLALSLFACALLGAFLLAPGCMEQIPSQPAARLPVNREISSS